MLIYSVTFIVIYLITCIAFSNEIMQNKIERVH